MSAEQSEVEQQLDQEIDQIGQEEEKPEIPEGFVPADENQRQVNKVFRKYKDTERAHKATQRELDEAKKRLEALEAKANEVDVPSAPDPFAEDFDERQKEREEAIELRAARNRDKEIAEQEEQRKAERAREEDQKRQNEMVAQFDQNTSKLGLKPLEMKEAADTVLGYGTSEVLEEAILADEDGPLILKHLASNPIELDELNKMSTYQLARHIETTIRPKAQLLKPKTSQAPDPPETLSGGGVSEVTEPWEEGGKWG